MGLDARNVFLRYVEVGRFGALGQRMVGPFGPGLNVVQGANESGKTTICALVEGVLFGWRQGRGPRDAYRPPAGERSGALLFAERPDAPEAAGCSRGEAGQAGPEGALLALSRTDEGPLEGERVLVADIDLGAFRSLFSLSSDELRRLRQGPDVAARLLTAEAGTSSSPAQALAAIQGRLEELACQKPDAAGSLASLARQRDEARHAVEEAAAQVEQQRAHHQELASLESERQALAGRRDEATRAVEAARAARAGLERLDAEERRLSAELEGLVAEEEQARQAHGRHEASVGAPLAHLSAAEDASIRERLDALAAREAKQEHGVETARSNYHSSKAAHEALREALAADDAVARTRRQRTAKVGVATVLTVAFLLAGVPVFMYGRGLPSLSYMILGGGLVLVALVLAAATLGMLLRPSRQGSAYEERLQDAQWVLLQDEKKLAACEASLAQARAAIADELTELGLGAAGGSVRRARVLMDEAKDVRSQMALEAQRQQASALRAARLRERQAALGAERAELAGRAGAAPMATTAELDELLGRKERDRAALGEAAEALERRWEELSCELAEAKASRDFDRCKLRCEELACRLKDAEVDYARLILARSMLERAIGTWESKSQPEVYQQASRLLALMTDGRWAQVRMTDAGALEAVDASGASREVRQLSLGTCQQLYLALRIALLTCAESLGRAIPVLADDILAHFDANRRRAAAVALAQLARVRQVILLTSQQEVVEAVKAADPEATVLSL